MASTYSDRLRIELMATGEKSATWGATANTNVFQLLEDAIAGVASISMTADTNYTLSTNNGSDDEARQMVLNVGANVSGTAHTTTKDILAPSKEKIYIVKNSSTGGQSIRILVTGNTAVTIPTSSTVVVYCDGTNFYSVTGSIASQAASAVAITGGTITGITSLTATGGTITGITDLAVADGGTGASTAAAAATALGVGTGDSPQFTAVNIGAATDTTLARVSAGVLSVEGNTIYHAGGTDVAVTDGGTGSSTAAGAATALGLGTGDSPQFTAVNIGHATDTTITRVSAGVAAVEGSNILLASGIGSLVQAYSAKLTDVAALTATDSNFIVGDGSTWVAESGATLRTSAGLGTGNSPQFTGIELGHATDTTVTRSSAGNLAIEGNVVYRESGTDVPVADGGTGASNASNARDNLDVAQIPNSSTLRIGNIAFCIYTSTTAVADGDTAAGNLLYLAVYETGVSPDFANGAQQNGTWRNISGVTQDSNGTYYIGHWVRTA